ncbi:MAG TPA: hypothetical protein V6C76_06600 [Drouetiella sp.]
MKARFYLLTLGASVLLLSAGFSSPAFSQNDANQITNYENQVQVYEKSLQDNLAAETTDLKVLNRLKLANSKKNAPLETKILGRLRYEKQAIALDENNIHSLESWIAYDKALEERELADQRMQHYNAEQDEINAEVARRNEYHPPVYAYNSFGSSSNYGRGSGYDDYGYGYGGYGGYGGGWHYHGGSHMHYSSGGGYSSSHHGSVRGR